MVTIEDCYEIRSSLNRTLSRCRYKYSMTKNKSYLNIVNDAKELETSFLGKDINDLDISRIKMITLDLYFRMRGIDNVVSKH